MSLLAATVRSFAHMPLGISDRSKMVLWPGCGGRAVRSLHKKNVRSVRFVVKRRGCCCNLSGGVALNVWFTTNGMCAKNNNIHMCREQVMIVFEARELYCCYCHGAKLCTHAARDFRSQHYKLFVQNRDPQFADQYPKWTLEIFVLCSFKTKYVNILVI